MASHRHDRLTEDIRRELTDIFRMLKDPRITGMISIVKVDLSGDQSYCKVYISSLDGLEAANRAVEGLKSAAGFIRREIGSRLKMRRTPEFHLSLIHIFCDPGNYEGKEKNATVLYGVDREKFAELFIEAMSKLDK